MIRSGNGFIEEVWRNLQTDVFFIHRSLFISPLAELFMTTDRNSNIWKITAVRHISLCCSNLSQELLPRVVESNNRLTGVCRSWYKTQLFFKFDRSTQYAVGLHHHVCCVNLLDTPVSLPIHELKPVPALTNLNSHTLVPPRASKHPHGFQGSN